MKALVAGLGCLFLTAGILSASAELDTKFQALQTAVSTNDPLQIKAAAIQVFAVAKEAAAETEPAGESGNQAWKERVAYARDIEVQAEYALYTAALKAKPAVAVDLFATLEQVSPASRYLESGYGVYLSDLTQAGQSAKIVAVAQRGLTHVPHNPDLLLVVADNALSHKQNDAAIADGKRLIAAIGTPSDARKSAMLGRGYYIAGVAEAERNEYTAANRDLRAALPLIQGDNALLAPTLFYLGVANYQLGKQMMDRNQIREAEKYSEQAAAMKSSYSNQAWTNAQIMKAELAKR